MILDYIDKEWIDNRINIEQNLIRKNTSDISIKTDNYMLQRNLAILALHHKELALFLYASVGLNRETIYHFKIASDIYLKMIDLRKQGFVPQQIIKFDAGDLPWAISPEKNPEKFAPDYSLTNSKYSLQYISCAFISNEKEIANSLIRNTWDPINASYVGLNSEVCTFNEHYFAYAIQELWNGNKDICMKYINNVIPANFNTELQKKLITSIVEDNKQLFLDFMKMLIKDHAVNAYLQKNHKNPDFFLCMTSFIYCAIAIRLNLISSIDLEFDSPFFPNIF